MEKGTQAIVRQYVARVVAGVSGMKALVLDHETTGIVSMVYTQSQILQQEVFLIDTLEAPHVDRMPHLKAVYFVRPTFENVRRICDGLRDPRYGEYHIFFSNIAGEKHVNALAEADDHEVIQQVQEMYGDYLAINHDLFSLGVPSIAGLRGTKFDQMLFDRVYQGLVSVLLSLKARPAIRYQASSEVTEQLATKVAGVIEQEGELFSFRTKENPPLLIIIDRREDAVTPLLNQWTYQAMVHELIGINNNRVDMSGMPGVKDDQKEVVLSTESDPFYAQNMFLNFGDLGANIKALVDEYQAQTHSTRKVDSIADMQAFVENYPEFRKMSGNVSKHVALMSELSRIVDARQLMDVSQIEQELACTEDHQSAVSEVERLLGNKGVTAEDKLRLVLLYALRYEHHESNHLHNFVDQLQVNGVSSDKLKLIPQILQHCGVRIRQGDLFSNKSFFAVAKKSLQRGIKGVQNVYTQHQPFLAQVLEGLAKSKLPEGHYPYVPSYGHLPLPNRARPPQEVVIFIFGGATFEEARFVAQFNEQQRIAAASAAGTVSTIAGEPASMRVLLGGTSMLTSASFLADLGGGNLGAAPSARRAPAPASTRASSGAVAGSSFDPRRLAQQIAGPLAQPLSSVLAASTSKTL
mmetsp:Transcript_13500/g.39861  ORF Transcript_13500/g.39861 Transcript_13500/m.39861 type:complete len:636 (+) Transcript_13500:81-1988(+)